MKIAILIRRYLTTGGAERYAVEVARRLAEKHEVHIFAQEYDHVPQRMTVHRVPLHFRKPRYLNQWWFSWWTSRNTSGFDLVYTHERVTQFDVMHIHSGTFVGGLWGVARGEKNNPFLIWLKILTQPRICAYWFLEKLHFRALPGHRWIAVSQMIKREVQFFYPLPDDRFFIAHSGADFPDANVHEVRKNWRTKLGAGEQDVLLIFVGSEFDRKGLGALIAALGILRDSPCKLLVLGGGKIEPYRRQAADLQISEKIIFAGLVKNASDYYAASDIFVLPTLSDPSPLSPLEAMAHGCVPLLSDLAANRELVSDGENGLIVAEDAGLARPALEAMRERAVAVARNNRDWVRQNGLFEPAVTAFLARLRDLASAARR